MITMNQRQGANIFMYENKTWGDIIGILREKAQTLGRAPQMDEIPGAKELINGLRYGGWFYVLGYAGIYPRAGHARQDRFPLMLEDFTDKQLVSLVRKTAWKCGHAPREQDGGFYVECIRRWGDWGEALKACDIRLPESYKYKDPLPGTYAHFYETPIKRIRNFDCR